ncbi:MAG TPA: cytochrome c3 family protein [Spirochaetota bacterium]|nr:cytochrome c3 family protein [Spirochaetota bacterium]HPV39810.1 cytochrome c3 family protein [Spirochaetota bacterium]
MSIAAVISAVIACSNTHSKTDLVTITGVNEYYTDADAAGGRRTLETTIHVTMTHSSHEKANVPCVTCHHKFNNEERIKKCAYCHKGLNGARMFHTFCIKCHADKNKGPVRCNECHIEKKDTRVYKDIEKMYRKTFIFGKKSHKAHEDAAVECNLCHHDAGKEKNKKKCDACHVGRSRMVILHYFCKDCHKKQGGPVRCQECHAGVESEYQSVKDIIPLEKTGHRLPQIQFNHKAHVEEYNTECVDCHHLGSMKKCSSCHGKKDEDAIINLKAAFHQQCHECHRRTAGPQACHNCHKERN